MRQYADIREREYSRVLAAGGIQITEGDVSYTADTAESMVDAIMERPLLAVALGIVPGSIILKNAMILISGGRDTLYDSSGISSD